MFTLSKKGGRLVKVNLSRKQLPVPVLHLLKIFKSLPFMLHEVTTGFNLNFFWPVFYMATCTSSYTVMQNLSRMCYKANQSIKLCVSIAISLY